MSSDLRRAAAMGLLASAFLGASLPSVGEELPEINRTGASNQIATRVRRWPVRFVVIGDFGSGLPQQTELARRMCRYRRSHPFRVVFTTGDNIYPDGAPQRFRTRFFRPYRCLLRGGARFRGTLGNHDVVTRNGRPELREPGFGMKGRNYVIERRGVRFVMADSNSLRPGWLRRATRDRGQRWTIVAMHHPVYSPGPHGSTPGFRPLLPRLFARRGVDLVLNGHDHLYSVTRPLRRIRYVVTGGGGASLYPCHEAWFTRTCRSKHHFLYVVARRRFIRVRAVGVRGGAFERFRTRGRD
jgi:hypothetical protein